METGMDERIANLLREYSNAAAQHGLATEQGQYETANAAYVMIEVIRVQICELGETGAAGLLSLVNAPDAGVRLWAATHSLAAYPEVAESVLDELAQKPKSFVAFSAKTTLQRWRQGKLTPS